jgi:hypothetical protein
MMLAQTEPGGEVIILAHVPYLKIKLAFATPVISVFFYLPPPPPPRSSNLKD